MDDKNAIPKILRYECFSPSCNGRKRDHNVVVRGDGEYRTCLACGCKSSWVKGIGGKLVLDTMICRDPLKPTDDDRRNVDWHGGGRPKGATDIVRRKRPQRKDRGT